MLSAPCLRFCGGVLIILYATTFFIFGVDKYATKPPIYGRRRNFKQTEVYFNITSMKGKRI